MEKTKRSLQTLSAAVIFALFSYLLIPAAHAATLQLTYADSTVEMGKTVSVSLYVSSPDQAMNASSGTIEFPADVLEFTSFSLRDSLFTDWLEKPFLQKEGEIHYEGGLLNPGFQGESAYLLTLTFSAKAEGPAQFRFSDVRILANDGLATNIFRGASAATIVIVPASESEPPPAPIPEPTPTIVPELPVISSPTSEPVVPEPAPSTTASEVSLPPIPTEAPSPEVIPEKKDEQNTSASESRCAFAWGVAGVSILFSLWFLLLFLRLQKRSREG